MNNHQVLIDFIIDDEKIAKSATEYAARQMADKVLEKTFGRDSDFDYLNKAKRNMEIYVKSVVTELLEEYKDEIIKMAVSETVKNLHRTKAVKELLEQSV